MMQAEVRSAIAEYAPSDFLGMATRAANDVLARAAAKNMQRLEAWTDEFNGQIATTGSRVYVPNERVATVDQGQ